jgi:cytochrome P450
MMAGQIDLSDPDLFVQGPPHALFAELRRTKPVHWQERRNAPGYWVVLKHADVRDVSRQPELFSSSATGVQLDTPPPEGLEMVRGMLTGMDPPRHGGYREPVLGSFTPRAIARLEDRTREITRRILAEAAKRCQERGHVEFVHEVCGHLPTRIFGEIVGLPRDDWEYLHGLVERMTRSQDPDVVLSEDERNTGGAELARYAIAFGARRRGAPPRDDLTSLMLEAEFGGKRLSDVDFGIYFCQFVIAANETTMTLLSSGLLTLLEHPDQFAAMRADPSLIPGAVEEMLRWDNPLHYLARTAMAETELRGARIKKGDKLAMYYTSANRDEDVFSDPEMFDIRRAPNPHVTFGYANHFCIGAHLTRLEGKVFFEELLAAFPTIETVGSPKRLRSSFSNALKEFPVFLGRR